jgi:hypothetical protein
MLVTRLVCLIDIPIKLPVTDLDLAEVNSTSSACLYVKKFEMHVVVETHDGVEGEGNNPRVLTAIQLSLVTSPIWRLLCFPTTHKLLYAAAGRRKTAGVEHRRGGSRIQN